MLIINAERLATLRQAQNEIQAWTARQPSPEFYETKLAETWRRASKARAYQNIEPFSTTALHALPLTSKEQLKADPWDFVVADLDSAAKYYETTGTSGKVTPTPRMVEDIIWNLVSVGEAFRDVLHRADRVAVVLPSDIVPVGDLVVGVCEYLDLPHTRVYPFATGISDWDRLITVFRTLRPTVLAIAPGVALQLTRLLKQRHVLTELRESTQRLLLLGELSTRALRERLGQWWQATAYDASYGSTETGTLAVTCPYDQLHLRTAANYFELTDDTAAIPLPASGTGRLVVTPLNLYARALLRYDTGDEVEVRTGCECGRSAPVVVIQGRSADAVRVRGAELTTRAVEELVYGATTATGYLLEIDSNADHARLLLERDIGSDRSTESDAKQELQRLATDRLGFGWDDVTFVNALPAVTKSGGSQKSWKRSNVRITESPS